MGYIIICLIIAPSSNLWQDHPMSKSENLIVCSFLSILLTVAFSQVSNTKMQRVSEIIIIPLVVTINIVPVSASASNFTCIVLYFPTAINNNNR